MPTPDHEASPISRRTFLSGSTAAAATLAAASMPLPALALGGRAGAPANVRVSSDGYPLHAEPDVASNPRDHRNLLGACMVDTAAYAQLIATYASFDGGSTWRSNGTLPLPPGTQWAGDVTVGFDGQGTGFVCAMATSGRKNDRGVYIWRTDDGGRSFAAPVAAMSGRHADHPSLAVDRSQDDEPGNLYAVWTAGNNDQLGFSRSTDGGRGFEPPRVIAGLSGPNEAVIAAPVVAAAPDGGVHAIYGVWPPLAPPDKSGRPEIVGPIRAVSSNDSGVTFSGPVELGMGAMEILMPGGASSSGGPAIAASPDWGAVYAAFVTHQTGADHTDVVVATSRDRGRSWSPAVPVTSSARPVHYFQPQLAVDESGRVAVSAFALERGRVDVVLFVSEEHAPRFGRRLVVTSQSFDPTLGEPGGGKHGAWWIGDYQGLASTPDAFHPFWNDTRTGRLELFTATVRDR